MLIVIAALLAAQGIFVVRNVQEIYNYGQKQGYLSGWKNGSVEGYEKGYNSGYDKGYGKCESIYKNYVDLAAIGENTEASD